MKRVISFILTACLVAALFLPCLTFTASASDPGFANDEAALTSNPAYVVRIGAEGTAAMYYTTITEALNAAVTGETVYMIVDILNIPNDNNMRIYCAIGSKSLTLDAQGHKITANINSYPIRFEGNAGGVIKIKNLSIKNDGTGYAAAIQVNDSIKAYFYDCNFETTQNVTFSTVVSNGGEINVMAGTKIINSYNGAPTSAQYCNGIRLNAGANAIANIFPGAEIKTTGVCVNPACDKAKINVYGGKLTSNFNSVILGQHGTNNTVNIYGGEFNAVKSGSLAMYGNIIVNGPTQTFNIYGGTFNSVGHNIPLVNKLNGSATLNVYGGVFNGGSKPISTTSYPSGKTTYALSPVMKDGASVRLVENSNGLRFVSDIGSDAIANASALAGSNTITYGTLICPTKYLEYTNGVFTKAALDAAEIPGATSTTVRYLDIPATEKGTAGNAGEGMTINAAMTDVKEAHENVSFSAVSYIKYGDIIVYSNYSADVNSRSIREVAYAALADVKTEADEVYTNLVTEYYVKGEGGYILVTGNAYSRYTAAQIAILKSYIA